MIREILLSTANWGEDQITEPPSGELSVSVVGDHTWLAWYKCEPGGTRATEPAMTLLVSAKSLMLALRAAWDDDHAGNDGPFSPGRPRRTPGLDTEPR